MSTPQLSPGSARTSIAQDALGRERFVKNLAKVIRNYGKLDSLTIGLYGPWGCGKSTLLNFVIEELALDEDIAVLRFNPWNFSQNDTLVSSFFSAMSGLIKRSDKTKRAKKAAAILDTLSGLTAPATLAPGLGVVPKALERFAEAAKDYADAFGDLEATKQSISDILVTSQKRFVIVIDDIDRLTEPEIRLMFQLVKSMADFKNVVYVMAFDRKIVAKALDGITGNEGNAYLEKVINAPISVPPLTGRQAQRLLRAEIDAYAKRQRPFDWHSKRQEELVTLIVRIVETVRQIERFTNALKVQEELTKDDVNFTDLIALTFIKATEPSLYDFIGAHPDIFLDDMMNQLFRADDADKTDRSALEAELGKVSSMQQKQAVQLLELVFPKVTRLFNEHGGSKHFGDREWRREFRACADLRTFLRYFALQVDEGDISATDRDALHRALESVEEFESFIRGLGDDDRRYYAMQYLADIQPDVLTHSQIVTAVTAIIDIGDELSEAASEEGMVACNSLLVSLPPAQRIEVAVAALDFPPRSVEMPAVFVARVGPPKIGTFRMEDTEQLQLIEAKLLERAWYDGALVAHKRMLFLINFWFSLSDGGARGIIRQTLDDNDEKFLKFLGLYENVMTTSNFFPVRFNYQSVARVYDLHELKARLERILASTVDEVEKTRISELLTEIGKGIRGEEPQGDESENDEEPEIADDTIIEG